MPPRATPKGSRNPRPSLAAAVRHVGDDSLADDRRRAASRDVVRGRVSRRVAGLAGRRFREREPSSTSAASLRLAQGVARARDVGRRGTFCICAIAVASIVAFLSGCPYSPSRASTLGATSTQVANLHAFARLYGVVRWFHPGDAAATVDWDRFAIEGVRRVARQPNPHALRQALLGLFSPFAPTVQIVEPGVTFARDPVVHSTSGADLKLVTWQHKGYGDSTIASVYSSKRTNRDRVVDAPGAIFGAVVQSIDATPLRGTRVRFRGKVRVDSRGKGRLWLRVIRPNMDGFFDTMSDRPVTSGAWTDAEIVGEVAMDATRIDFGELVFGPGIAWYDSVELAYQSDDGVWRSIAVGNPDFEEPNLFASWRPGSGDEMATSVDGWSVTLDSDRPASGAHALRIQRATVIAKENLFDLTARPGEAVEIDLGSGLRARVPIALYSMNGQTIGDERATVPPPQHASSSATAFDALAGVADVVVAWNVLNHFWPYWDVVPVDWNAALDAALADALDDQSVSEHAATLRRLAVAAPDGHSAVNCPGEARRTSPPFSVDLVENQVVVTASHAEGLLPGDIVVQVDGQPAAKILADEQSLVSGSPQWRARVALERFGTGPEDKNLSMQVRRGGAKVDVIVMRTDGGTQAVPIRPAIMQFDDGVFYVDLSRAAPLDLEAAMSKLVMAPGVVFDVRQRPSGEAVQILSHLLERPDDATSWFWTEHVIRPDHPAKPAAEWEKEGWGLPVLQPHISGRVAFLSGPGAISFAESFLQFARHYRLGEIVGTATAGTNGNIAQILAPTGCTVRFTGMRTTNLDGSRFHLIGVLPTISVTPTIAGVVAGRDEVLEKALGYVRTGAR